MLSRQKCPAGHDAHARLVAGVQLDASYCATPHGFVQLATDLFPRQYDAFGHGAQTLLVRFVHGTVSYVPGEHSGMHCVHCMSVALEHTLVRYVLTGHCLVQLLITVLPLQKYAPTGHAVQTLPFLYMEGMQVKLHQVPFHDDMLAMGVQAWQVAMGSIVALEPPWQ